MDIGEKDGTKMEDAIYIYYIILYYIIIIIIYLFIIIIIIIYYYIYYYIYTYAIYVPYYWNAISMVNIIIY